MTNKNKIKTKSESSKVIKCLIILFIIYNLYYNSYITEYTKSILKKMTYINLNDIFYLMIINTIIILKIIFSFYFNGLKNEIFTLIFNEFFVFYFLNRIGNFSLKIYGIMNSVVVNLKIWSFLLELKKIEKLMVANKNEDDKNKKLMVDNKDISYDNKNSVDNNGNIKEKRHHKDDKYENINIMNNDYLNIRSYLLFFLYPSLCFNPYRKYELNINKKKLLKTTVKTIIFYFLLLFYATFVTLPQIIKTKENFIMNYPLLIMHTFLLWLIVFQCLFNSYLEIFNSLFKKSEVFYLDWENSTSFSEFWKKWNIQVHLWLKKYIYNISIENGISNNNSVFLVFLFSAFLHEYLISIILKKICGWFFLSILASFILFYFDDLFRNRILKYLFFWILFSCIGQPLLVYFYYCSLCN